MVGKALFVKLEAKPGKESELEQFLASALPLAQNESGTITWFALKFSASTFGIYDTFQDDAGRQARASEQHETCRPEISLHSQAKERLHQKRVAE